MSKKKVLLVGCGEVGSRHLQAISCLEEIGEICIIDQNPRSVEVAKKRLLDVTGAAPGIKFNWYDSLNKNCENGDLCIVATLAKKRREIVMDIVAKTGCKKFIVEKIVTQSVTEYKKLIEFSNDKQINIWVNCQVRSYKVNKYIKSLLNHEKPIHFSVVGGNRGLACTGIHLADLFVFLDGTNKIVGREFAINDKLVPSKRGADILDLSGTISGDTDKGSTISITFHHDNLSMPLISILNDEYRFIIDPTQGFAVESNARDNWAYRDLTIKEDVRISNLSKNLTRQILLSGTSELPALPECLAAHEFILDGLLPFFNKLLKKENDYCPVS